MNQFFDAVPSSPAASLDSPQSKYYGGEERIAHGSGNAMVLAFSGSSSPSGPFYKPEISVLAALLGGQSTIKWSSGFSLLSKTAAQYPGASIATKSQIYSDAGLLSVTLSGSAKHVGGAAAGVVKALEQIAQGISKEDFQKAKATAKFKELEFGQSISAGIELTGSALVQQSKAYQIDDVAKGYDAVTEESVKQVSFLGPVTHTVNVSTATNPISRPQRPFSRTRHPSRLLVTCTFSLTPRTLASGCKYRPWNRDCRKCTISLYQRFCVDFTRFICLCLDIRTKPLASCVNPRVHGVDPFAAHAATFLSHPNTQPVHC